MRLKYSDKKLANIALKYQTRGDFQKYSPNERMASIRRGIYEEICQHMARSKTKAYSKEELHKEALKYETRGDFVKYSDNAYQCALRSGILNEICQHMAFARNYWNFNLAKECAKKYSSRSEFRKFDNGCYQYCREKRLLNSVCSHMKKDRTTSLVEKEIEIEIKRFYKNSIKLRDRNVKIENKPYIKGFDIDIFLPELNKGIEVDGHYYHSFEFMRKDVKKIEWSDDDIRNYHKIKDEYFLYKDIKVLHITDLEWKNNKEQSLSRILDFLRN